MRKPGNSSVGHSASNRDSGDLLGEANSLVNLGHPTASLGMFHEAWSYYIEALELTQGHDGSFANNVLAEAVMGLASILGQTSQPPVAVAYLSTAADATSGNQPMQPIANKFLIPLQNMLTPGEYTAALEHGKTLQLEAVIGELLAMEPPEDRNRD